MGKGNCKACKNLGCAALGSNWTPNPAVECFGYEPRTNADRIRAMTDEELAKYLEGFGGTPPTCDMDGERDYKKCRDCWIDWLGKEVDNG